MSPAGTDIRIVEPLCSVFRRKLRSESLKYTPERAKILDAVLGMKGVFQAEELIDEVRASSARVSKATVYRTLKLLLEAGIVQQVLVDPEQAHYVMAYGRGSLGLLVRVDTHAVTEINLPELDALRDRVCAASGLKALGHRFVVYATA
ncbi:MAG: transcriptional repressor [Phycisphaerae bacterium]|nr:transcriptional repressor [Phycisphaerae bacterium]